MINALEATMIFCWGLSWPISLRKSFVSRTSKGKSLGYELLILLGCPLGTGCTGHFVKHPERAWQIIRNLGGIYGIKYYSLCNYERNS